MLNVVYTVRALVLAVLLFSLFVGGYSGYLTKFVDEWRDLRFATQMILTVLFGWSLAGFVTPVLLDLWSFIAESVVGLGGSYMVTDRRTQLLLLIIAVLAVQTTVLMTKLKTIEEEL